MRAVSVSPISKPQHYLLIDPDVLYIVEQTLVVKSTSPFDSITVLTEQENERIHCLFYVVVWLGTPRCS